MGGNHAPAPNPAPTAVSAQLKSSKPRRDHANACSKASNVLLGHQNAPDYTMLDPQTVAGTPSVTCTHHREYTIFEFAYPQLGEQDIDGIGTKKITVIYDKNPANPTTDIVQRFTKLPLNRWSIAKGIVKVNTKPSGHGAL